MRSISMLGVVGLATLAGIFAFFPLTVCPCYTPEMRFHSMFKATRTDDSPQNIRRAILARVPVGAQKERVERIIELLNLGFDRKPPCVFTSARTAYVCDVQSELSMFKTFERRGKVTFLVDPSGSLTDVQVEKTSILFGHHYWSKA
jgi:hypothetical protein